MSEPNGTFYISPSKTDVDTYMDPKSLMALHPKVYGPRFEAVSELRKIDDGSLHRGSGFRRVASFVSVPLFSAVNTVLDPEFMKDKKRFYSFLRRNREYCTYDIRSHAIGNPGIHTFIDGKAV